MKSALKFQRQILTINVPSYKSRRQTFSLSVHANLYYTSVGMLLNYSVIEYWRHEFCQVQERQLGRFYLHSATLQCRPNHRHLWLLPNSIYLRHVINVRSFLRCSLIDLIIKARLWFVGWKRGTSWFFPNDKYRVYTKEWCGFKS